MLGFAAGGIALSMLDDCVVDVLYLWLVARRRTAAALPAPRPSAGWMAIVVPAWDEAAVIGAMLTALIRRLDYPRYRVFVGVYPNDPATAAAIRAVVDPRIAVVTCTRPGPTTKADCLNHLWRAVRAHETAGIM